MANVTELRVTLTVEEFDQALAFYRDVLGLQQVGCCSGYSRPMWRAHRGRRSKWVCRSPTEACACGARLLKQKCEGEYRMPDHCRIEIRSMSLEP